MNAVGSLSGLSHPGSLVGCLLYCAFFPLFSKRPIRAQIVRVSSVHFYGMTSTAPSPPEVTTKSPSCLPSLTAVDAAGCQPVSFSPLSLCGVPHGRGSLMLVPGSVSSYSSAAVQVSSLLSWTLGRFQFGMQCCCLYSWACLSGNTCVQFCWIHIQHHTHTCQDLVQPIVTHVCQGRIHQHIFLRARMLSTCGVKNRVKYWRG